MNGSEKRFVTADEICEDLQICKRTLSRMVEDGRFPQPLRLGLRKKVWLRQTYVLHSEAASKEQHVSGTR